MNASRTLMTAAALLILAGNACCDPRGGHRHEDRERNDAYRYEQRERRDDYRYQERRDDRRRSMGDVIGEVEHNYRGRVVDVQAPRPGANSEDMYRVRVLQDGGRVKTLRVPADRRRE